MANTLRLAHFSGSGGEAIALIDPDEDLDDVAEFAPYGMELVSVTTVEARHPTEFPGSFPVGNTFKITALR